MFHVQKNNGIYYMKILHISHRPRIVTNICLVELTSHVCSIVNGQFVSSVLPETKDLYNLTIESEGKYLVQLYKFWWHHTKL